MSAELDVARERVGWLKGELERANQAYYVSQTPVMTDAEWDELFDELSRLEAAHPELVTEDSPTQRVGALAPIGTDFAPVKHSTQMLSLAKANTLEEIRDWDTRVRKILGLNEADPIAYSCEPKYDGLSIEIVYRQGKIQVASTRGDGMVGEDVTPNVKAIKSAPGKLGAGAPELLEVRGEIYIPIADFQKLNAKLEGEGKPAFANPRNSAAGSLRQKDSSITATRPLQFVAHGLGLAEGLKAETHSQSMTIVKDLGVPVTNSTVVGSVQELADYFNDLLKRRDDMPYEMDGVVIKVNRFDLQRELGWVSRSPRWAIAWKFPPAQRRTRILRIIPSVGRTGAITPFAELEPVVLSGARVKQASLFNLDEIRRKDIREGDVALVQRGGDVIPNVVGVFPELRPPGGLPEWQMPENCPACGAKIERVEGEAVAYCTGVRCPVQLVQRVFHFGGRTALDIVGLGEKTIVQLVEAGLLADVADVFYLTREKLIALERMGAKSVDNLLAAIAGAKDRPLQRLIHGLGIRHVGAAVAGMLANAYPKLADLASATEEQLRSISGIGAVVAASIAQFFRNDATQTVLRKLTEAGVRMEDPVVATGPKPLAGKTVVITGSFATWSRDQLTTIVTGLGAKVSSSVSKKTDWVFVGADAGSKAEKAKELNRPILEEPAIVAFLRDSAT